MPVANMSCESGKAPVFGNDNNKSNYVHEGIQSTLILRILVRILYLPLFYLKSQRVKYTKYNFSRRFVWLSGSVPQHKEKHALMISENTTLRRTFEPKTEHMRAGWKNLHNRTFIIQTTCLIKYYYGDKIKNVKIGAAYSMQRQDDKCLQNLSPRKNLNKETI